MLQTMKNRIQDQRGLTLIELLAVIVILGIVAAIAVPSIGGIIQQSENDATVAEGIQIISAAKLYHTSNPDDLDITHTELDPFIDNIQDTDGYTVNIDANGDYSITGHPSVPLANTAAGATTASEAQLLAY